MDNEPVYMIGIAAKLAGVHPQTLRIYERRRLVCPERSAGSTRLYSRQDVERLKLIQQLTQGLGMNLAGVEKFFELRDEVDRVRSAMERLEADLERAYSEMDRLAGSAKRYDLVPIPKGEVVLRRMVGSILER